MPSDLPVAASPPTAATLVACAPEAVFVADGEGRLLLANQAATALLGIGPGECVATAPLSLVFAP